MITKQLRAYAYVRVSVDDEGGGSNASIEAQKAAIRALAAQEGVELLQVYEEPDVSGRKLVRKQFDRMIGQATSESRPVDMIIVYSLSRFARRLLTQVVSEHKLTQAGVELVSVTEGSANDPNSKLKRQIIAIMNEKYALDASLFTRRDRRGNAQAGYWNGGPSPYGYRSYTASMEGRKARRKIEIFEEEAAIVRLIFNLALRGLDGQPMGTRSIAAFLNGRGYTLNGKPFRHSNVDGILTRQHYGGFYYDRTSPKVDGVAAVEDHIQVYCPMIVEPDVIAAVAARRALAAPKVTAPRLTNSPVLLTALLKCGAPGCSAGMVINSGKSTYRYYKCERRTQNKDLCRCTPIREEKLDKIVVDALLQRILQPDRLILLLTAVLGRSGAAELRRKADLDRVRRERAAAEGKLRRLLDMVAEGLMDTKDPIMAERLAEYKASTAGLRNMEASLARQLASNRGRVDDAAVQRFGKLMREKMLGGSPAMRKAYVRLLVSKITVNDQQIVITGSKAALEAAVSAPTDSGVISFDRGWCRLQDSNL